MVYAVIYGVGKLVLFKKKSRNKQMQMKEGGQLSLENRGGDVKHFHFWFVSLLCTIAHPMRPLHGLQFKNKNK